MSCSITALAVTLLACAPLDGNGDERAAPFAGALLLGDFVERLHHVAALDGARREPVDRVGERHGIGGVVDAPLRAPAGNVERQLAGVTQLVDEVRDRSADVVVWGEQFLDDNRHLQRAA